MQRYMYIQISSDKTSFYTILYNNNITYFAHVEENLKLLTIKLYRIV